MYPACHILTPVFLLLPFHQRDFLTSQTTVQVIYQPVNLRVRRLNPALESCLLRDRLRGGKLLCYPSAGMSWKNRLYFGDNLKILREYVPDASVDLIYLDPPFSSGATYNLSVAALYERRLFHHEKPRVMDRRVVLQLCGSLLYSRRKAADLENKSALPFFLDDKSGKARQVIVHVKSGYVSVNYVRDLKGAGGADTVL